MLPAPQSRSGYLVCVVGLLLGTLLASARAVADEDPPRWLARWGERGSGPGQFEGPRGLTLDGTGRILVCDTDNNRIQIFDTAGTLLDTWGETGSGPGQFQGPIGIDVAPNDEVYIVDTGNRRVQRFGSDGTWLGEWDGTGHADPLTWSPFALTVDRHHNVYVTDGARNISRFNSEGVFERSWSLGDQQHMWDFPAGIAASPKDYIYVTRTFTAEVYQFELDGTLVRTWGGFSQTPVPGTFKTPLGVDVDSLGNVFVIDHHNWRIQKFTGSGEFLSLWGSRGCQPEQFNDLHDITVGAGNNLFIVHLETKGYITHWSYDVTSVEATSMSHFKSLMRGAAGH